MLRGDHISALLGHGMQQTLALDQHKDVSRLRRTIVLPETRIAHLQATPMAGAHNAVVAQGVMAHAASPAALGADGPLAVAAIREAQAVLTTGALAGQAGVVVGVRLALRARAAPADGAGLGSGALVALLARAEPAGAQLEGLEAAGAAGEVLVKHPGELIPQGPARAPQAVQPSHPEEGSQVL